MSPKSMSPFTFQILDFGHVTLNLTHTAFLLIFDTCCLHKLLYNFLFELISEIESPKSMIIFTIFRIEFGTFDSNLVVESVIGVMDRSSRSNEVKKVKTTLYVYFYISKRQE